MNILFKFRESETPRAIDIGQMIRHTIAAIFSKQTSNVMYHAGMSSTLNGQSSTMSLTISLLLLLSGQNSCS